MAEQETAQVPANLPKVLIVDDSRMVRASLVKQIRNRFQIREETDGEAGWEALLVDPEIRLVLTDLGMPRLDGFGLLERIRSAKLQRISELPVVIISGDEDDLAHERALKLGANDFVSKGAGVAEMTARLESLLQHSDTRRDLEESRKALSSHSPLDPASGLATSAYLNLSAEQQLAHAKRHQLAISVMVVEIDHYEQLIGWHGKHVADLISRKLAKILVSKVRLEDTVTEQGHGRFAVLSPSTTLAGCSAFAVRMQRAMEKLVMTYREERIRITMTIGISGSEADDAQSVEKLIETATERVQRGIAAGGNRIVSDEGEVDGQKIEQLMGQILSIDHVLLQLRIGATEDVMERLPDVIATAMPLFKLLEERLRLGIPLGELERHSQR